MARYNGRMKFPASDHFQKTRNHPPATFPVYPADDNLSTITPAEGQTFTQLKQYLTEAEPFPPIDNPSNKHWPYIVLLSLPSLR